MGFKILNKQRLSWTGLRSFHWKSGRRSPIQLHSARRRIRRKRNKGTSSFSINLLRESIWLNVWKHWKSRLRLRRVYLELRFKFLARSKSEHRANDQRTTLAIREIRQDIRFLIKSDRWGVITRESRWKVILLHL